MTRLNSLASLPLTLSAALPSPTAAADAAHGEQLAKRWCASRHVVASGQTRGADNAPAFATIAKTSGFSEDRVMRFLMTPTPRCRTCSSDTAKPTTSVPIS